MTISISFSDKTVRVAVELNGAIESLTTELPQRQWIGLTDEDRQACAQSPFVCENYLAIEAKLKEKNT